MIEEKKPPVDELDNIAAQAGAAMTESAGEGGPHLVDTAALEQEQAAAQMAKLEAGMQSFMLAFFKVGRAIIAKHLPEIRDEWPDAMLQEPAAAAVPLIKKHMGFLMEVIGRSPELAAMVMACFPLGMGLIAAMDKASDREKKAKEKEGGTGAESAAQ